LHLMATLLVALAGCQDTTAPIARPPSSTREAVEPAIQLISADTLLLFDDAIHRILPTLDQDLSRDLRAAFEQVVANLGRSDGALAAVGQVRTLLARNEGAVHPATLTALRLQLERTEALLNTFMSQTDPASSPAGR